MDTTWDWWSTVLLILLFFTMVGLGASWKFDELFSKIKEAKAVIITAIIQFIFMPFVCYMITRIFSVESSFSVGIILIGCSPGGVLSNIMSYIFISRMNCMDLSITMSTFSSLLSLLFVPFNMFIYLELLFSAEIDDVMRYDVAGLASSMAVIIGGSICGLFLSSLFKNVLRIISVLCMIGLIVGTVFANTTSNTPFWQYQTMLYVVISLPTVIGSASGIICGKLFCLNTPHCIVIALETGMQNQLLSIVIITLTFNDIEKRNQILGIPLVYAVFSTIYNAILCTILFYFGLKHGFSSTKSRLNYATRPRRKEQVLLSQLRANKNWSFYSGIHDSNTFGIKDAESSSTHDFINLTTTATTTTPDSSF